MADLSELYQQVILDHNRKPRNFKVLEGATRRQEGYNPLCGDQLTLYLEMDGDTIKDVAFQGSGCAISKASASMMTVALKGKTKDEAETLFNEFHRLVKGELDPDAEPHRLGRLTIFQGVREFPARVKCASLSWHTAHAALAGGGGTVSTEAERERSA
jgi:nitrogen fixation protein NifU and related proteins